MGGSTIASILYQKGIATSAIRRNWNSNIEQHGPYTREPPTWDNKSLSPRSSRMKGGGVIQNTTSKNIETATPYDIFIKNNLHNYATGKSTRSSQRAGRRGRPRNGEIPHRRRKLDRPIRRSLPRYYERPTQLHRRRNARHTPTSIAVWNPDRTFLQSMTGHNAIPSL